MIQRRRRRWVRTKLLPEETLYFAHIELIALFFSVLKKAVSAMNRHQPRTPRPLSPEAEWVPPPIFVPVEFVCEKSQVGDAELHKVEAGADFAAVLLVAKEKKIATRVGSTSTKQK